MTRLISVGRVFFIRKAHMSHRLLFLDLETTGLNHKTDAILEIACAIAEPGKPALDSFHMERAFHSLVHPGGSVESAHRRLQRMNEVVTTMHARTGLTEDLLNAPRGILVTEAESKLLDWLDEEGMQTNIILAGNSIWFDRQFIQLYMPRLYARLHYRMVDVTTLYLSHECTNRPTKDYELPEGLVPGMLHRALYDVARSMLQYDTLTTR